MVRWCPESNEFRQIRFVTPFAIFSLVILFNTYYRTAIMAFWELLYLSALLQANLVIKE